MATVIGILGETSSVTANSTQTLYTVPTDKHARVRILYMHEGGGGTTQGNLMVFSPNSEQTIHDTGGSGTDHISGAFERRTHDTSTTQSTPATGWVGDIGFSNESDQLDMDGLSKATPWMCVPFPADYFGSAGDIIQWRWQNQPPGDCLIQVYGIEVDNAS
jgi:hypothetical protein